MYWIILSVALAQQAPKELDPASQAALGQTQQLLTDTQARQKEIKQSKDAAKADQRLKATGLSGQSQEQVYGLSSQIFEALTKATGGDPEKMSKILADFQKNPESIRPYLNETQLKEINALGKEIENPKKAQP